MNLRTALVLGRVSNLPTVWTNALAALALSGALLPPGALLLLLLALTLFYTGGMYLNDAFDAEIDRAERKSRPIPRGEADSRLVFVLGVFQMALATALAFTLGFRVGLAAVALGAAIFAYDVWHKQTVLSPVLMGLCRMLVYLTAALAVDGPNAALGLGAVGLFCYVVGLTYAAKQEAYDRIGAVWPLLVLAVPLVVAAHAAWGEPLALAGLVLLIGWMGWALRYLFRRAPGDVPRAVVALIAGIALYDATLIAGTGAPVLAFLALIGFALTLLLQRVAPGT
ncbi:MAG: UbiA family prenyltransferase [Pseudomonadota bacterium]